MPYCYAVSRLFWLINTLLFISLCLSAHAQNLRLGLRVLTEAPQTAEAFVRVDDLELNDIDLGLRIAYGRAIRLGLSADTNFVLGPIGNVTLEAEGDVTTAGQYLLQVSGSGVIGSTAAGLGFSLFNRYEPHFYPERLVATHITPQQGEGGFSLGLSGSLSLRPSRLTIVRLEPEFFLLADALATRMQASVQLRQLIDRDEGRLHLRAFVSDSWDLAVGAEYRLNRSSLPFMAATLWLARASQAGHVGFTFELRDNVSLAIVSLPNQSLNLQLQTAFEPYRSDQPGYRSYIRLELPLEQTSVIASLLNYSTAEGLTWGLSTHYQWRF